jgi:hypothetical protein
MGEISESEHMEKMSSHESGTAEQTQDEPISIIPSQAAAEMNAPRRRSEGIAARQELENESHLRINPEQVKARRREMRVEEEERVTRDKFIKKKQEHEANVNRGVNIPQLNKEQMRRLKVGLSELFKNEINSMITNMIPEKDDWNGWLAFEGAYEESMHCISGGPKVRDVPPNFSPGFAHKNLMAPARSH